MSEHMRGKFNVVHALFDEDFTPFDYIDPDVFINLIDGTSVQIQDQDPLEEIPGFP